MKWKIIVFLKLIFISITSIQSDDLLNINEQFLATYDRARNHLISITSPIIICNGDNATILFRGERYEEQIIPQVYHDLKSISHIPFKIYLTVMFESDSLSKKSYLELKQYLQDIRSIRNSIQFPSDIQQTQYDIIDLSVQYLREILKTKSINQTQLKTFCQQARILFSTNIDLAARVHLDMLDSKMRPWYQNHFNDTERDALKIIIMGPKTARYGYVTKSYFYALLDEKHEGKHIIYVESIDNEQKALEILGVWLLDAMASDSFFNGDTERLHRDLLADAAGLHIKQLFKKSKNDL